MTEANINTEFDEFMEDWNASDQGHKPAYYKEKKEDKSSFVPGKKSPYKNIWEAIEDQGVDRRAVEFFSLKFDTTNNLVTNLQINLFNGDEIYSQFAQLTNRFEVTKND